MIKVVIAILMFLAVLILVLLWGLVRAGTMNKRADDHEQEEFIKKYNQLSGISRIRRR